MRSAAAGLVGAVTLALCACGGQTRTEPATATNTGAPAPLQPANGDPAAPPLQPTSAMAGYSCSFPGPDGRTILARFTLDGSNARDDEGVAFRVLSDSPTAVVLARARDDVAAPSGDVGAYVVAIDKRDLSMVQSTVGVKGASASRKGRCIAG